VIISGWLGFNIDGGLGFNIEAVHCGLPVVIHFAKTALLDVELTLLLFLGGIIYYIIYIFIN
jgi:hypothetical protein